MGNNFFNRKGLTLVEVVVALAVFMIAVVMAYPIITYAGQSNIHSRKKMDLQEMGNYVAENISYIANEALDETQFKSRLKTYGLCVNEESVCTNAMDIEFDVGHFYSVDDKEFTNLGNAHDTSITLIFKDDTKIINIIVEKDGIKFETLEYLRYEQ